MVEIFRGNYATELLAAAVSHFQLFEIIGELNLSLEEICGATDLAERAATALDEAHEMPPGDERTEAMQKAVVLRNASEIQHLFGGKRGAPTA